MFAVGQTNSPSMLTPTLLGCSSGSAVIAVPAAEHGKKTGVACRSSAPGVPSVGIVLNSEICWHQSARPTQSAAVAEGDVGGGWAG